MKSLQNLRRLHFKDGEIRGTKELIRDCCYETAQFLVQMMANNRVLRFYLVVIDAEKATLMLKGVTEQKNESLNLLQQDWCSNKKTTAQKAYPNLRYLKPCGNERLY